MSNPRRTSTRKRLPHPNGGSSLVSAQHHTPPIQPPAATRAVIPHYTGDVLDLIVTPPEHLSRPQYVGGCGGGDNDDDDGQDPTLLNPDDHPFQFDFTTSRDDLLQTIALIDGFETVAGRDGILLRFELEQANISQRLKTEAIAPHESAGDSNNNNNISSAETTITTTTTTAPAPPPPPPLDSFEKLYFQLFSYQQIKNQLAKAKSRRGKAKEITQSNNNSNNTHFPTNHDDDDDDLVTPFLQDFCQTQQRYQQQQQQQLIQTTQKKHNNTINNINTPSSPISATTQNHSTTVIPPHEPARSYVPPQDANITGLYTFDNIIDQWPGPDLSSKHRFKAIRALKESAMTEEEKLRSRQRWQEAEQARAHTTITTRHRQGKNTALAAAAAAAATLSPLPHDHRSDKEGEENDPQLDISVTRSASQLTTLDQFRRYKPTSSEIEGQATMRALYSRYTILFSILLLVILIFVVLFMWMASFSILCLISKHGMANNSSSGGADLENSLSFACFQNSTVTTVFLVALGLLPVSISLLIGFWNTLYYLMRCCGLRQPLADFHFKW